MPHIQSLNDVLTQTPHVRLATSEDNQALLNFYHQSEMTSNKNSIRYTRGLDFFQFLNERSDHNLVFTIWNEQNVLEGMAVITYYHGFMNGKSSIIGYLGDLRVNLNRKLIREWRKFYSLLIEHSPVLAETFHCRYYQTVIIDDNSKAKNNLVETKIENLKYEKLESYCMYNIVGRVKTFTKSNYQITSGKEESDQTIINFLNQIEEKRSFGKDWNYEFYHRLKNWNMFSKDNFIIVKNSQNDIVAITSFWNPIKSKQVVSSKIPLIFKMIVPVLNILPFFDFKPLPSENKAIDILYLNQVAFSAALTLKEKQKILFELIHYTFQFQFSILAIADFQRNSYMKDCKTFIGHTIPMAMYTVHHVNQDQKIRDAIQLKDIDEPGFEMCLV